MFDRFTDRARKVLQLAGQEAQRLNHNHVGTEHLLLGLVKEGSGVAANVLKNLDVDVRKVRLAVETIVQPGAGPAAVAPDKLPHTPRARKVLECATEEARHLDHNYVGTEHLLLGLLREREGAAAEVLTNLGLRLEDVREEVLNLLGVDPERKGDRPRSPAAAQRTSALDGLGRDLTDLTRCGKLDATGARAAVVERIRDAQACLEPRCVLLLTDSAFERRAAAAALAQALLDECGLAGAEWRLLELSLRRFWLGTAGHVPVRDRLRPVLQEIRQAGRLLVYVPDLEAALAPDAPADLAQSARLLLLEVPQRLVAALSPRLYRSAVEPVEELARAVCPLFVPAPTAADIVGVLRGEREKYEAHHGVRFPDETLTAAAELSLRHLRGPQPDQALAAMDVAGARVRRRSRVPPPDLGAIDEQVELANREKESAVAAQDFARAARLRDEGEQLKKKREQLLIDWRERDRTAERPVAASVVAEVVSELAGPDPRPDAIR